MEIREDLTAEQCEELAQEFSAEWNAALERSGQSRAMFIATNSTAPQMLYLYTKFQEFAKEKHGLDFPDLAEGVTVTEAED